MCMEEPIVEVKNLSKKFGKFTAVDDISFSIKKGEIVGLLGPNGAGKTTTTQMLLGLITPTNGTIHIFGKNFIKHREEILSRVNFSSTYTHLPFRLSVWENLYTVALLYRVAHPKEKVEEVIQAFNLGQVRKTPVNDLSSGWVTKVNLARAFLNDPQLILLDEPTASLDPESAMETRRFFLDYQAKNNIPLLWTSHNMAEVEEVCDRVIFLNKGKIVAEDTPEGLAKRIKKCRVNLLITDKKEEFRKLVQKHLWLVNMEKRYFTVELNEDDIASLIQLLVTEKIPYSEISIEKPTLEDFFISVAKKHE